MVLESGYYWFTSERSSFKTVGQLCGTLWYLIGEELPVPIKEINRRGWNLGNRIEGQDGFR